MTLSICAAVMAGTLGLTTIQTQQPPPPQGQTQAAPRRPRPRPAATHVVVRDQSGTPLASAHVTLSGAASKDAVTDGQGAVSFPALRDGTYRLRFEHEGFFSLERELTIRNGLPAEVEVALNAAPPPPPPPPPPQPEPPSPPPPQPPTGPPVLLSIPAFLDRNFIGREPLKESVLGCTAGGTTRLLQLHDGIAPHTHADLDEVLYVVAGSGAIRIREEATAVGPGFLSVIPRGLPHAIERRGKNPLVVVSTLSGAPCGGPSLTQSSSRR